MEYQVLARKWRPHTFEQLIGQDHVVQTLSNALDHNRIHHALLFTGGHGIGKTTIARIIAKCLNCEQGPKSNPCGQCFACEQIDAGRFIDLIEVDAASRTKVEDTRDLLDNVPYAPTQGRYKVYLIDEVHMLSTHSFNALLKTLEEPPPHTVFLLATTEKAKIPNTIISRCLQFTLKLLTPEQITLHLCDILGQEDISFEHEAIQLIAQSAHGSVRDSLSLLDQAIAYGNGKVNCDTTQRMLGSIDHQHLFDLMTAIYEQNAEKILSEVAQMSEYGINFHQVLEALLHLLHEIAIAQALPTQANESISALANRLSPEQVQLFYQIALTGRADLPLAPSDRVGMEMLLLRMMSFIPNNTLTVTNSNPPTARKIPPNLKATSTQSVAQAPKEKAQPIQHQIAEETQVRAQIVNEVELTPTKASSQTPPNQRQEWKDIAAELSLSGTAQMLASHCALVEQTDERIHLHLSPNYQALLNKKQYQLLTKAIQQYFQRPINVDIDIETSERKSPAQLLSDDKQTQLRQAQESLEQDVLLQEILATFDGTLLKDTIQIVE